MALKLSELNAYGPAVGATSKTTPPYEAAKPVKFTLFTVAFALPSTNLSCTFENVSGYGPGFEIPAVVSNRVVVAENVEPSVPVWFRSPRMLTSLASAALAPAKIVRWLNWLVVGFANVTFWTPDADNTNVCAPLGAKLVV